MAFRQHLTWAWLSLVAGYCLASQVCAGDPLQNRFADGHGNSEEISFTRDVIPALTKAGCNAGACHGSFQGRGGLTLSLLGFNPVHDYEVLTKASRGRRINLADPDHSLLLRKPTGRMPHGGGVRIEHDSATADIFRAWLSQGASAPKPTDLDGLRISVEPPVVKLAGIGSSESGLSLQVWGYFGDGEKRDVTPWALFEMRDKTIAEVSSTGVVKPIRAGKTAVTVRYLGQVFSVPVLVPVGPRTSFEFPPQTLVDELAAAEWKNLGIEPAPLADDATFLRRVYLDLIGTLPTAAEAAAFIASTDPRKRASLIDALLERPEYVDYWSLKWGDLLRAHRRYLGDKGLASFNGWIRGAVRDNKRLDHYTREILTAQGNLFAPGPVGYYFIDDKVEDLAETTSQVFLGVRLQCTKCHHHPNEVWSQDDYYGLAAFFTRLEIKDSGPAGARFGGPKSIRASLQENPKRKAQVASPLRIFGEAELATSQQEHARAADLSDPREQLAAWITRPDNPYFARNFVNRYWAALFGIGLIEPVDDLRATNPASLPTVLDALAEDFASHDFDVKHLLRTICNSRVYQLAPELRPDRDSDGSLFTHRTPRRLSAEVLLDAINQVTGVPEDFPGQPAGTRAIALPDPSISSQFLTTFGRPQRNNPCECARGANPDLSQALLLANSPAVHDKIISAKGWLATHLGREVSDEGLARELYLSAFSRQPTADELQIIRETVAMSASREEAWQDIVWAILNCPEFGFNH